MSISRRAIAACGAVTIAWALVVPLATPASATHPTGSCLDVTPESATNTAGAAHGLTATLRTGTNQDCTGAVVTRQDGGTLDVNFEITGPSDPDAGNTPATADVTCVIRNNQSSCTATYTGTVVGTDTIVGWIDHDADDVIDADDPQDTVAKTWAAAAPAGAVLDCDDASGDDAETNPAGASETYTCTATQPDGPDAGTTPDPLTNVRIDAENLNGANDLDNSSAVGTADFNDACTTGAGGTCTIVIAASESQTGTANVCFWLDADVDDAFNPAGEAADGGGCNAETAVTEDADTIDVVTKTWAAGTAASVAISPTSDSASVGACNPFTITVRDSAGQPVSGTTVDVEQTHALATNNTANDEPTVDFCLPRTGVNPSEVETNRGDLRENPDNRGTAGGETRLTTDASGQITIGVTVAAGQGSDGTGTVSVIAFVEPTDNDDPDAGEPQVAATKTWISPDARTIDCEPESAANPTGATHTVTCTARDRFGEVVAGEGVTFSESGPGDFTTTTQVTTNAQGVATATVTSSEAGTQTITGTLTDQLTAEPNVDDCERAANDPAGAPAGTCADSVTKTWSTPPPPPVTCPGFAGDARNQVVGTVDNDQLIGTEGDDIICALGGDDIVDGLGGDDLILLGGGNDGAFGRDGNDVIRGAGGDDLVAGGDGRDRIRGGAGHDGLKGNSRADVLRGGIGRDILVGGPGNDSLFGGAGSDNLRGNGGGDLLNGGRGFDTCLGGRGSDVFKRCERRRR